MLLGSIIATIISSQPATKSADLEQRPEAAPACRGGGSDRTATRPTATATSQAVATRTRRATATRMRPVAAPGRGGGTP